jgi:hypothetical protein
MQKLMRIAIVIMFTWTLVEQAGAKTPRAKNKHIAFQKASDMNILYVGVDNRVEINAPCSNESALTVKFVPNNVSGEIKKQDNGHYLVTPSAPGYCQIDIYDGPTLLNSQTYKCHYTPDPVGTLDGKYRGGNLTPKVLENVKGIVAVLNGFDWDYKIKIDSFSMLYEAKGELYTANAQGPLLTEEMKSYMANAKHNDIIIIRDIALTDNMGNIRRLAPILIMVI